MKKISSIEGKSEDTRDSFVKALYKLSPEIFTDGKIDLTKFSEIIGEDQSDDSERFGLFWPGKKRSIRAAQESTQATLNPNVEESLHWNKTDNIFVEGDNLEVLKIMQKHYHNKIKVIYIDPPYNTGKDFVYPDNYKEGLQSYLDFTKQTDEVGKRVSTNTESEGRFHSNWLCMMYPRLKLSRNLLTDDGVIFISIDDNEQDNLKKLCNEIFGEDNFAGQFVWKKGGTGKNDSNFAVVEHEYILAYTRNSGSASFANDPKATVTTSYNRTDDNGNYSLVRLDSKTIRYSESLNYEITGPDNEKYLPEQPSGRLGVASWRWNREKVKNEYSDLVFEKGFIYTKNYEKEGAKARSLLSDERFGVTRTGRAEAESALGQSGVFDFPKPVRLIQHLLRIVGDKDAIVLDFFAGSGTTAHACLAQNVEDGGNRKFIVVQLPEPTPEDSRARELGYKTISQIARKRILGAISNITKDNPKSTLGFRAFKLADTNFSKWKAGANTGRKELEDMLLDFKSSTNISSTKIDLFFEILIKLGLPLNEKYVLEKVNELSFYSMREKSIILYLENDKPTLEELESFASFKPKKIVILEDTLQGDDELKTNFRQVCDSNNIELWTA